MSSEANNINSYNNNNTTTTTSNSNGGGGNGGSVLGCLPCSDLLGASEVKAHEFVGRCSVV